MTEIKFQSWGKIPRLNRPMVVTEKIDGTQAAVGVVDITEDYGNPMNPLGESNYICVAEDRSVYAVYAQSRNRIIHPKMDNHGFANWVWENAVPLVSVLGPGIHFGEWWGSGIQRGYGLAKGKKYFSLFNTKRWGWIREPDKCGPFAKLPVGLDVVPIVHEGPFSTLAVAMCLESLKLTGSLASPGFMRPEGVVVFHTAGNSMWKATIEGDELPKSVFQDVSQFSGDIPLHFGKLETPSD